MPFDTIGHEWLIKFLEHRIGDQRVLRLIRKWLTVGVSEAEACLKELQERFAKFGLKLHEMKTRLIEFGRIAIERRQERGEGKPETFDFLGFTHRCDKTRSHGWFTIARESIAKRMRAKLAAVKELLRRRRHWDIGSIGRWLSRVTHGWYHYHAIPGNMTRLQQFRDEIIKLWLRVLRRRSQRKRWTWSRMQRLVRRVLPTPKIIHPYPEQRFRDRLKAGAV